MSESTWDIQLGAVIFMSCRFETRVKRFVIRPSLDPDTQTPHLGLGLVFSLWTLFKRAFLYSNENSKCLSVRLLRVKATEDWLIVFNNAKNSEPFIFVCFFPQLIWFHAVCGHWANVSLKKKKNQNLTLFYSSCCGGRCHRSFVWPPDWMWTDSWGCLSSLLLFCSTHSHF